MLLSGDAGYVQPLLHRIRSLLDLAFRGVVEQRSCGRIVSHLVKFVCVENNQDYRYTIGRQRKNTMVSYTIAKGDYILSPSRYW